MCRQFFLEIVGVSIGIEMHLCCILCNGLHRQRRRTQRVFVGCQLNNVSDAQFALNLFYRLAALIRLNSFDTAFRFHHFFFFAMRPAALAVLKQCCHPVRLCDVCH